MPSIDVDDEVYAALTQDQGEDESLSDVIKRWFDRDSEES